MFFKCDCGSEVINVERDLELFDGNKRYSNSINFCIYHLGTENHKPTFREKLRHCWIILKTGKHYADQIILTGDAARELGMHLLELTDKDNVAKAINLLKLETNVDKFKEHVLNYET